MRLWKTNIIKKPRNLWMPPVPAWSVKKQKKDDRGVFRQGICIPWGILANVKISRLSAWSEGLCDLFPRATHEGNKSHNLSLQADNPFTNHVVIWDTQGTCALLFDRIFYIRDNEVNQRFGMVSNSCWSFCHVLHIKLFAYPFHLVSFVRRVATFVL